MNELDQAKLRGRIHVVDLWRGIAIVLMALDHVREFLQSEQFNPLDLDRTTVALFFTRWVTHFCAPIFILLAGAGIALALSENRPVSRQARLTLLRGLWLITLELTVVHLGWFFNFQFQSAIGGVLWAIGWSMVCMSALIFLPPWLITTFGLTLIVCHNGFDSILPGSFGGLAWVWKFLHDGGLIDWGQLSIYIAYPLIPWVGVMAAGFGLGSLLRRPSAARSRSIAIFGFTAIALFVLLRGGNLYGNPTNWTPQRTALLSLLSVLNCQKYPPSLAYLLMTLGPVLACWPWLERWKGQIANFFMTFGRVPLFFYVLHLPVIHGLTVGLVYFQTRILPDWLWDFPPGHAGPGCGVPLPVIYLIWITVIAAHYPVCSWYGRLKSKKKASSEQSVLGRM